MRQVKAKRQWWEDPGFMSFIIAMLISTMILYVFILQGEWVRRAIDFIIQIQDAYLRWVN